MVGMCNPSWVQEVILRLEKAEEPRAMKALQQVNNHHLHHDTHWEILSPEEAPPSFEEGMPPLNPSFEELACILHQCRKERNLTHALHLHAYMCENGLEAHPSIGNCLVSTLVEVGSMCHAQQVFERLVHRDESSWNSLIVGYVKHGKSQHALTLYQKMQEDDSVHANGYAFVALLKACATLKDLERGHKLHAEVDRKGLLEHDVFVCSTLVDMYAKCGSLAKAQEVFDKLQVRNVVTWNALLTGYAEHGHGEEALNCFEQMQHEGFCPSAVTLVCILKACGVVGAAVKGSEIHAEIARKGFLEINVFVGSTLVDMYANCGSLTTAQEVFDKLPVRDVVSWNALISGYVEHGRGEEALHCFDQMQHEGISRSAVTFVCGLKACGSIGATVKGQEIHTEIVRKGLEKELLVGSTLVDMNSKCGLLAEAQEVFDELQVRDVVSWTALISGYAEHGRGDEALFCFEKMQQEGISPDAVALVCSLTACGSIGASVKGQEIHAEIAMKGLERELLIGNTLVDMYAECGSLATAQEVFDKLPFRDLVSWNALIAGYAQLGESENVFHIFDRMVGEGLKPDLVTIVSVLNACSHAGLVDKGQMYLQTISDDYGVTPTLEHYSCMVDLLGRAGRIDKAVAMMKKMPFHPGITLWHTVLGACRKWGNVELGRHAFEHAVRLDEKDAAAYVCMFNIYADAVMQENGYMVKAMRMKEKAWRKPGHSWWADGQEIIHLFSVGNQRRPAKRFMQS